MTTNNAEGFYNPVCNQSDVSGAEQGVWLPVVLMKTETCFLRVLENGFVQVQNDPVSICSRYIQIDFSGNKQLE